MNGLRGEALRLLLKLSGTGKTIFTVEEAQALTNLPPDHVNTLLYRLAQKRWLERLERGTYLILPLEAGPDREWSADRFLIASYLVDPCAIGYWSALGHWNLTSLSNCPALCSCRPPVASTNGRRGSWASISSL